MFSNQKILDILNKDLIPDISKIIIKYLECPDHKRIHPYFEYITCTYQFPYFELSERIYGDVFLILGRRSTGKSTFIRCAFSNIKEDYSSLAMTLAKHNTYPVDNQIYNYKMSYIRPFLNDKTNKKILIIDDCFTNTLTTEFNRLFTGMDYTTDYFISCQFPGLITPYTLKEQIRYLVILKEDLILSKRRLYENYVKDFFANYGHFNIVMDNLKKYQALVFDMALKDIYFYQLSV